MIGRACRRAYLLEFWGILVTTCLLAGHACGELKCDRIYPVAVQSGTTSNVTAEGKFDVWPVDVWCDRDDVHFTASEKQGVWQVRVDEDARPGVAWLRFMDRHGATNLQPLLIVRAPVSVENEPNGRPTEEEGHPLPCAFAGKLQQSGDVDVHRLQIERPGTITVRVIAHQVLNSPMDAVLQLCDASGNVLAQNDDARQMDPQISFPVKQSGPLFARIFAFPETPNSTIGFAGGNSFAYLITVEYEPSVDFVFPLYDPGPAYFQPIAFSVQGPISLPVRRAAPTAVSPATVTAEPFSWQWLPRPADWPQPPGDQPPSPTEFSTSAMGTHVVMEASEQQLTDAQLPAFAYGVLREEGQVDTLHLQAVGGRRYAVEVSSPRWGFAADPRVRVVAADGKVLASADDLARNQYDARAEWVAPTDGKVRIEVSDAIGLGGPRHAYVAEIRRLEPAFHLTCATEVFSIASGETKKLKIDVKRVQKFDRPIEITCRGLPEGVRVEPAHSQPEQDKDSSVELQFVASDNVPAFQGWVYIVGAAQVDVGGQMVTVERAAAVGLRPAVELDKIWLVVPAASK